MVNSSHCGDVIWNRDTVPSKFMIEDHGALEAWWRGRNFLINDGIKCRISFVRTTLMDCKKKSKWNITQIVVVVSSNLNEITIFIANKSRQNRQIRKGKGTKTLRLDSTKMAALEMEVR